MVNRHNVQKWVDALRSGEYKQGQETLHRGGRFCCLGVACDISGTGSWVPVGVTDKHAYHVSTEEKSHNYLPPTVQAWLGVASHNPFVADEYVSEYNDHWGKLFSEIADLIEAEFLS